MARAITNPDRQAGVLVSLAEAVAGTDPDRARGILAGVLSTDFGVRHLGAVGKVDLPALVQICDHVLARPD